MKIEKSERLKKLPPYLFVEIDRAKKKARDEGRDVIDLYNHVGVGADVFVISNSLTSVQTGGPALADATAQAGNPPSGATPNPVPPQQGAARPKRRS